ncbi:hypothetical protein N7463_000129 [Penicillium fimorum]|uniref:Uncharacterized protein n=1 Tax=Penicillium fimorum TaxID=1882269 RepID=A0A9W9Y3U3_9EURO|nr:hypothetical protein N7463_000129 [Penicillium fimorum]
MSNQPRFELLSSSSIKEDLGDKDGKDVTINMLNRIYQKLQVESDHTRQDNGKSRVAPRASRNPKARTAVTTHDPANQPAPKKEAPKEEPKAPSTYGPGL